MITVSINLPPETKRTLAKFSNLPAKILGILQKELFRQMDLTISHAQRKRLSFPKHGPPTMEGLRVQTNRLRSSLSFGAADTLSEKPVIEGNVITGSIGSNVRYAGIHEFGFDGTVGVKAHSRRRTAVETLSYRRLGKQVRKKVRLYLGDYQVKAHDREVHMPARAYLRKSVDERMPEITEAMGLAVLKALE